MSRIIKSTETENRLANGHGASYWGDENVPMWDYGDGCTTQEIHYKSLNCTFKIYKFYAE